VAGGGEGKSRPGTAGWMVWTMLATGVLALWLIPLDQLPTACLTRRLTGVPCPTCGVGRSLHALVHGDIAGSLHYHPLVLPFLAGGFIWWITVVRPANRAGRSVPARLQMAAVGAAVVILVVVWLLRLSFSSVP